MGELLETMDIFFGLADSKEELDLLSIAKLILILFVEIISDSYGLRIIKTVEDQPIFELVMICSFFLFKERIR